ncbi:zinc-binding alcohol dehydrogenase family protein [Flavobacterium psychrotrophum]|uniref:zinc-binding alcohol dehydrogenase family protein n=1 Tax=Flavobacterium psychrotrophum TaxID=2294119 RepID=UPI000E310DE9|nr:zinc-binding alcohol dehydrogenase family protein [Flavobacterium psychrotrophum]
MKYIVCEEPYRLLIKHKPMPELQPGEVLLKLKKAGVCGTDLHAYEGTQPFFEYPRILGHELAAEYVAGNSNRFNAGDRVTVLPYFNCGTCVACRNGHTNCCEKMNVFGVHTDGGMCEYITLPEAYVINGQGLSYDELVVVEPLAIAAHGIKRAGVTATDTVLVMGIGPIGAGLIAFAKIAGAKKIIAMDVNNYRLGYAKNEQGADAVINPLEEDVISRLREITDGDMPTVVIDATGNKNVMNDAFKYMAHSGRYVLVGLQKEPLTFSHPEFHKRESTLMSSRNATKADFDFVITAIKSGNIDVTTYITHRLSFDSLAENFETLMDSSRNVLKAVIEFDA